MLKYHWVLLKHGATFFSLIYISAPPGQDLKVGARNAVPQQGTFKPVSTFANLATRPRFDRTNVGRV